MGTVTGVVRLADGAELPRYPTSGLSADGPTPLPADCTPETSADREPMALAADRGLSNVPVVAMGDATRWPAPGAPRTVPLRIRNCRLDPWVVTATIGDVLRIENELVYPFFPAVAGLETGFNQAILPGEPRELELDSARPMTMQCTVTTGCRRAELLVLHHPVHTVSAEAGRFTLSVPAEQEVELVARDKDQCGPTYRQTQTFYNSNFLELSIPNVFTPNGDGINDYWRAELVNPDCFGDVQVYNRWGEVVYEANVRGEGWDGRVGGEDAPEGVYVYILKIGKIEKVGTITLVR